MDVDLALDHKLLQEAGYETIRQRLESHGYRQDQNQPFIFYRDVPSGDNTITIEVDLLIRNPEQAACGKLTPPSL